ncbi:MAG: keto-hydroxyglutarate-aldolase/keto-deoxy-phosphogluconate aldolase, partial [Treponema sp.]|nr:keto-hydroxyglutarate-aldolase/keto-deoxy-phosphogluconate aldolase [Treponema sp.]
VKKPLIEGCKWDEITQICKDAVKAMHSFRVEHMGINAKNADDAASIAEGFGAYGFAAKVGNSSIFASDQIEIMKENGRGTHGHISVLCNNVERALAYLEKFGFKPVAGTEKWMGKAEASPLKVVYLDKEVGGFAIHLKRA